MIELRHSGQASLQGPQSDTGFIRITQQQPFGIGNERRMGPMPSNKKPPKRSQTQYNYQLPQPPPAPPSGPVRPHRQPPEDDRGRDNGEKKAPMKAEQTLARRPLLGPPRRSYSVMDYEPLPHHHRPSARLSLMDLPVDMHLAIFDFLDPIDSTCMGLTNRHFYSIHWHRRGPVPLSTRRDGPNELEWAWHLAGHTVKVPATVKPPTTGKDALSSLRVRGQAYCRKCGVTRCELHKHIQDWMGEEMEYCSIKRKYGPKAPDGARLYCYMSKPDDPHRCGRHRMRKSKVVLQ